MSCCKSPQKPECPAVGRPIHCLLPAELSACPAAGGGKLVSREGGRQAGGQIHKFAGQCFMVIV